MRAKFVCLGIAAILAVFCVRAGDKPRDARKVANKEWYSRVQPKYRGSDTVCLYVTRLVPKTQVRGSFIVGCTPKCYFYIGEYSSCYFDKKEMRYVDNVKRATYVVRRKNKQYKEFFVDYILAPGSEFRHLYMKPLRYSRVYTAMFDTMCDGKKYKVFVAPNTHTHAFNEETQKFDLPHYTDDYFFCDADNLLVDSISIVPQAVSGNQSFPVTFRLHSAFGSLPDTVADVFNMQSVRYSTYTRYDEKNPPPSGEFNYCPASFF